MASTEKGHGNAVKMTISQSRIQYYYALKLGNLVGRKMPQQSITSTRWSLSVLQLVGHPSGHRTKRLMGTSDGGR